MVDDQFLDKHLLQFQYNPLVSDIENYLKKRRFPQHFSYRERCKIVRKSATYTWIAEYLFNLGID